MLRCLSLVSVFISPSLAGTQNLDITWTVMEALSERFSDFLFNHQAVN